MEGIVQRGQASNLCQQLNLVMCKSLPGDVKSSEDINGLQQAAVASRTAKSTQRNHVSNQQTSKDQTFIQFDKYFLRTCCTHLLCDSPETLGVGESRVRTAEASAE